MKKIILGLIILLTLTSCAASNFGSDDSIYTDLFFNKESLTYTNNNQKDLLYDTGNPVDDFFILYESFYLTPLSTEEKLTYELFLNRLIDYITLSNDTYGALLSYTSAELNSKMKAYQISITLNDIVIFNQIKDMIEQIEKEQFPSKISKINYIEKRLELSLTITQKESLEVLYIYYRRIETTHQTNYFVFNNLTDFKVLLDTNNIQVTEDELLLFDVAYDLISQLLKKDSLL